MKTRVIAAFAVVVLWLGLSFAWMGPPGPTWASDAATTASSGVAPSPAAAPEPQGPVMTDLSLQPPMGPVMTDLQGTPAAQQAAAGAPGAGGAPPAAAGEALARLQAAGTMFSVALTGAERQDARGSPSVPAAGAPSIAAQFAAVFGSAPVIGFLLMLLLALAVAAWGRPGPAGAVIGRAKATLHRLTAPAPPHPLTPGEVVAVAARQASPRIYGRTITHVRPDGQPLHAGVFDENQVRAAAGLTLALGAVAFGYAALAKVYLPIQTVTALFFAEFLIRVTWGITLSPLGVVAGWMTRRSTPHWVSAKPKRFAWSLGVVMALAMMVITNSGIRGPLPLTICLICLTLMWLEAVLGLCLGCEVHRLLVRWGWMQPDKDFEICADGACIVQPQPRFAR